MKILRPSLPALVLAFATGCGGEPPGTPVVLDLLARPPVERFEQLGVLKPGHAAAWLASEPAGWAGELERPADGPPLRWTGDGSAHLQLGAAERRDRDLAFQLRAADGPARVTVLLNGVELGVLEVGGELAVHEVYAPASAWVRGRNHLELRTAAAVGLARLGWGRPRRVELGGDGRLSLGPGTGVGYELTGFRDVELVLAGPRSGAGELVVEARELDVASGRALGEPIALPLAVRAGGLSATLPLPDCASRLLALALLWRPADGESALELSTLELRARRRAPAPPVIFISIDTLAARHTSLHGYARDTTPRLRRLAEESVVFERCWANAPWTVPSYMSQFTGLYPKVFQRELAELGPDDLQGFHLPRGRLTLAEMLRAAGYRTGAFVDSPWLTARRGFTQGFDHYDTSAAAIGIEDPAGGLRHLAPLALEWLAAEPDEPAFAFLQAVDVHAPYLPAEPWAGALASDGRGSSGEPLPVGPIGGLFGVIPPHVVRAVQPEGDLPAELAPGPFADAYDEEILALDAALGELFDGLRATGLLDRAVLVLSADHGESMTEHEWFFDHGLLYEESLHVPLLVRLPGGRHGGLRVEQPVQLVDLWPTVAELAGLELPAGHLHGASLVPLIEDPALPRDPPLAQGTLQNAAAVVSDGWKLIQTHPAEAPLHTLAIHPRAHPILRERFPELQGDRHDVRRLVELLKAAPAEAAALQEQLGEELAGPYLELYHLPGDPLEERDLAAKRPDVVAELARLLQAGLDRTARARAATVFEPGGGALSEEARAELRKLGYLGDG